MTGGNGQPRPRKPAQWFHDKLVALAGKVAIARPGARHQALLRVARLGGGFLAGPCGSAFPAEAEVVRLLTKAAEASGLPHQEAARTIADGLTLGKRTPVGWPRALDRPHGPAAPVAPGAASARGTATATRAAPAPADTPPGAAARAPGTRGFAPTDLGNAERFAAYHGQDFRFMFRWNKWLTWDGTRWTLDDSGRLGRAAKDAVRRIYAEAADEGDTEARHEIAKWAMKSEEKRHVDAMIALAKSELPGQIGELDRNPWLLNTPSGTVDLRTGELRTHNRGDLISKIAAVPFVPDAECPLWVRTLRTIFAENEALVAFWQRLGGIALTGDVSEQILPIAYGDGSNGKSTILNAMLGMLGDDYATKAAPDLLMIKRFEGHPTERASLFGKRLVVAIETGEDARINEPLIKELTGSDKISARRMREDFWEFFPTHKIILCTNHKPVVRGIDWAIWRRLKLIPFAVKIPDERQDRHLPAKLVAEYPGILAWCVRGGLAWQEGGLNPPQEVIAATDEYRKEQDWLDEFLAEECERAPAGQEEMVTAQAQPLYRRYKRWADQRGEPVRSEPKFAEAMKAKGFVKKKSSSNKYLGLRPKAEPDDAGRRDL